MDGNETSQTTFLPEGNIFSCFIRKECPFVTLLLPILEAIIKMYRFLSHFSILIFLIFLSYAFAISTIHARNSLEKKKPEMASLMAKAQNWTMAAPLWPSSSEIPELVATNSLEEEQNIINRLLSSDKNAARELYGHLLVNGSF
jgi:hypothetical protein